MKLTLHTDYAYRVLIHLAVSPKSQCTVGEIAGAYDISAHHLTKIVGTLARAGFVTATRGRNGGARLARPPESINLGAVARTMEEDFDIVVCFAPGVCACRITSACRLAGVMNEALTAFLAVLDRYTLAQIVANENSLRQLLSLPDDTD